MSPEEVAERTERRLRAVKRAGHDVSLAELAHQLGVTPETVTRYRRRAGIQRTWNSTDLEPFEVRVERARKLIEMGENLTTIRALCHFGKDQAKRLFPEAAWTREMMNEAAGLTLRFTKMTIPRPRYIPAEPDDREEDR